LLRLIVCVIDTRLNSPGSKRQPPPAGLLCSLNLNGPVEPFVRYRLTGRELVRPLSIVIQKGGRKGDCASYALLVVTTLYLSTRLASSVNSNFLPFNMSSSLRMTEVPLHFFHRSSDTTDRWLAYANNSS
jgi:hypothetical protein